MRTVTLALVLTGCQCGAAEDVGALEVRVGWPGASPDAVEASVLVPVEGAVARLPGADVVVGVAREGGAGITVHMKGQTDLEIAELLARHALDGLTLPEGAGPPVLEQRRRVDRVVEVRELREGEQPAEVAGERARHLMRHGHDARVLSDGTLAQTRLLDAEAVVARGMDPRTLLERLARGESVPELDALSSTHTGEVGAWFRRGATPLAVIERERTALPADGWQVLEADTCVRAAGPEAEVVRGLLPDGAVAGGHAGEVLGWSADPVGADALGALPGIDVLTFPCNDPPTRLALVARTLDADLDIAVADLARWSGSEGVLPVFAGGAPEIAVRVDRERAGALGVDVAQVAVAMRGAEQPDGTRVRWAADDDARALGRLPLVTADGVVVPLQTIASLELSRGPAPVAHVNGRRARLVDVVLAGGVSIESWSPPTDIELIVVR